MMCQSFFQHGIRQEWRFCESKIPALVKYICEISETINICTIKFATTRHWNLSDINKFLSELSLSLCLCMAPGTACQPTETFNFVSKQTLCDNINLHMTRDILLKANGLMIMDIIYNYVRITPLTTWSRLILIFTDSVLIIYNGLKNTS